MLEAAVAEARRASASVDHPGGGRAADHPAGLERDVACGVARACLSCLRRKLRGRPMRRRLCLPTRS